jgi:SAM-dependent methyltransferase
MVGQRRNLSRQETAHVTSKQENRCRVCGKSGLQQFLDLGAMSPANALLQADELKLPEARYPLALSLCSTCELIQLTHVVPPQILFQRYVYFSSVSKDMGTHFAELGNEVVDRFVPENGLVVEIGSNDGILLRPLLQRKVRVLGVDPARNVAEQARKNGVPTVADFFTEALARDIHAQQGPASAFIGNNVFAHIDDLDEVMKGINILLADDGVLIMEFPYVVDFLDNLEFDTVYHEHLSYFGTRPLAWLLQRYGFELFDVRHQKVHGGSMRAYAKRRGSKKFPVAPAVAEFDQLERQRETASPLRLARFSRDVAQLRTDLRKLVSDLRAKGKRVVGYTAPAKGNVLLNYCDFGPDQIEYLADATPAKQGLFSPGMRIPIRSPEHFGSDRPDYALLLAWNHKDEILRKETEYRAAGGRFIIPVPKVEVI